MRIGVDIEQVKRFELPEDNTFIKNNFTNTEREYAFTKTSPAQHFCGFFCAKEAAKKTLNKPIEMSDMTVTHDDKGRPTLEIEGEKLPFDLSISHTTEYAVAIIINKRD